MNPLMPLGYVPVFAPRMNANDEYVQIDEWRIENLSFVLKGSTIAILETTKSSIEVEADANGYLHTIVPVSTEVAVGTLIAVIGPSLNIPQEDWEIIQQCTSLQDEQDLDSRSFRDQPISNTAGVHVTKKARQLIDESGLNIAVFEPRGGVIREEDVRNYLDQRTEATPLKRATSNETPETYTTTNHISAHALTKAGESCFVAEGVTLTNVTLGDRVWINKFATIYGSSVEIGSDSYIGPYVWIEGHAGISIGEFVHIAGPGTCIYSHSGMKTALMGARLGNPGMRLATPFNFQKPVRIESNVWIGPNCTIFPGVVIESYVVVMPGALVKEGTYPSFALIHADGRVELDSRFVRNLANVRE